MENVDIRIEDEKLILTIDLRREIGISKTGRSVLIGSSAGNVTIWQDGAARVEKINISCFRAITAAETRAGVVTLKTPEGPGETCQVY